jgi:hypothetical protein
MKWLSVVTQVLDKIPFEKIVVKPPSNKERLQELQDILGEAKPKPAEAPTETVSEQIPEAPEEEPLPGNLGNRRPQVHLDANPAVTSTVSTKETVDYQNREIGKVLLNLQRHCTQKFRIAGRACDCGQSRHLLEIEALAEEAIGMVDNPDIYYRILNWVNRLGPISTVENVESGKYDDQYPAFGLEARDMRKELLGTLDPKALFPHKEPEEAAEPVAEPAAEPEEI